MGPAATRPTPKYLQIVHQVRQEIVSGELPPGAEVPSERQIAARWRVARPTAARALQALRAEGLVEPRPGAGTFVRVPDPRSPALGAPRTGGDLPAGTSEELVRATCAPAPDDVAALIGVPAGTALVCRHRIVRDGGTAVEASTTWFGPEAATAAPRQMRPDPIPGGDLRHLEQGTGRRAARGTESVRARAAGAAEARLFGLATGAAVLAVRRVLRDTDGTVLLVRDAVHPPPGVVEIDWTVS